jgi:hypothetical protein
MGYSFGIVVVTGVKRNAGRKGLNRQKFFNVLFQGADARPSQANQTVMNAGLPARHFLAGSELDRRANLAKRSRMQKVFPSLF